MRRERLDVHLGELAQAARPFPTSWPGRFTPRRVFFLRGLEAEPRRRAVTSREAPRSRGETMPASYGFSLDLLRLLATTVDGLPGLVDLQIIEHRRRKRHDEPTHAQAGTPRDRTSHSFEFDE
jgi:hypothetical protein